MKDRLSLVIAAVLIPIAYILANPIYKTQIVFEEVFVSKVTLLWLIIFVLWGVAADRFSKKMSKRKGWLLYAAGTACLLWYALS